VIHADRMKLCRTECLNGEREESKSTAQEVPAGNIIDVESVDTIEIPMKMPCVGEELNLDVDKDNTQAQVDRMRRNRQPLRWLRDYVCSFG